MTQCTRSNVETPAGVRDGFVAPHAVDLLDLGMPEAVAVAAEVAPSLSMTTAFWYNGEVRNREYVDEKTFAWG